MSIKSKISFWGIILGVLWRCAAGEPTNNFQVAADRFADTQVLRYQVPGFTDLPLQQKKLAYFLYEAGLSGRDIFYDQRYRYNLTVRKTLEAVLTSYKGNKAAPEYQQFLDYARRVFFANGIHHHYSHIKMIPEFPASYLHELLTQSAAAKLPLGGRSVEEFEKFLTPIIEDPKIDAKSVDLSQGVDVIKASCNNFYEDVTQKEAEDFYLKLGRPDDKNPVSYGLNSQLTKQNGTVTERIWRVGGMYSPALEKVVYWLKQAVIVAENSRQKQALEALISFYTTGDLAKFDLYSTLWVRDTESTLDAVNGFIEVYEDALQKKGSFESVVSMKDVVATKMIAAIAGQAQWFEDHSPILPEHKKKKVVGISAKVITVIGEVGNAAPATPIGINLPNAEWIREQVGSKSVSLGNIIESYNYMQARSPVIQEFAADPATITRVQTYGALSSSLLVDMHEVIGHASGQLNPGIMTPDKTLKNYAGTLEEARADLVGLYYIMDPKLVEMGLMPNLEVGKAEYDSYVLNGLMTQLYRIPEGENIEEAHMRNRQLNCSWVYLRAKADDSIQMIRRGEKTYFKINNYPRVRELFGLLLREIQRIKSEGDFNAAKELVETFGVKADQTLLKEVHRRYEPLHVAPFMGFIQPKLIPVRKGADIVDVQISYPTDFVQQMLEYGRDYAFLPIHN